MQNIAETLFNEKLEHMKEIRILYKKVNAKTDPFMYKDFCVNVLYKALNTKELKFDFLKHLSFVANRKETNDETRKCCLLLLGFMYNAIFNRKPKKDYQKKKHAPKKIVITDTVN